MEELHMKVNFSTINLKAMENIIIQMANIIQGNFKKGLKHGIAIKYEQNGNKIYEGGFINDKRDGIGKYYNEDGQYYVVQWKDDTSVVKGTMYYQNGNV